MKHLLIDFENIQPQNLNRLPTEDIHVWLFLGALHKSLPIGLVQSLLRFGERVHLIQLQKSGKNALDFYLSYYLGQITATDPEAHIGILSRDGGYDVLVEHIVENRQAQEIVRLANIDEVQYQNNHPSPSAATPLIDPKTTNNTPSEKLSQPLAPYFQAALSALRQPGAFHPRFLHNLQQNLCKYILRDLFQNKTDNECEATSIAVINKLKAQNLIRVDEHGAVSYHISDSDLLQKIQRYILNTKPPTYADFQAAVQNRADAFALSIGQGDIQAFARHLREQNLIRQNNGNIEYAPFAEPEKQPATTGYHPDETVWKKIMAPLSVAKAKRPKTLSSLKNTIRSSTKSDTQQTEKLLQHLQDTKFLRLDGTKVVYLNQ